MKECLHNCINCALYPAKCVAGTYEELDIIHNEDCAIGMSHLPDSSIDLIITSPPYDNLRKYNGYKWDFEETARQLFRITKNGGVVVWVVADATLKGSETGTSFKHALFFKNIGFNLHDTMIWEKTGMLPTQDRYYNIFEYMFIFSKGKPKTMNFICDHKTTAGGRVQKKDACINKGGQQGGIGTFIRKDYSRRTNIWRIPIGKNPETRGHPAPFPEQLANDHIITWSNPGDVILDPFMGSGTTAKMAKLNNRHYVGFEINPTYVCLARNRLDRVMAAQTEV